MTDNERDMLLNRLSSARAHRDKYARYAFACERALEFLNSAVNGYRFLCGKQTENVCGKLNGGIHPNQTLLNRMCLSRHDLDTDINTLITTVKDIASDARQKEAEYEEKAMGILNQIQWG